MATGLISSGSPCSVHGAFKRLECPMAISNSSRFVVARNRSIYFSRGREIKYSSSEFLPMRELSGGRGVSRIFVQRCNARKKDDSPEDAAMLNFAAFQQASLWIAEAAYILWLFLLPYAPGDPVWAISPATVSELIGLSLNFFFVLPIMNLAGINVLESPVIHPMAEGLFNFVLGWTLMFAPLLFTDNRKDRFKGSLDILWGLQMFLTNTFLIPYMAIRLNQARGVDSPKEPYLAVSALTRAAGTVAAVGGVVCGLSLWWAVAGRPDAGFGGLIERVDFFWRYVGSERLAYAFLWDILLYSIFQPWLIGDNLENIRDESAGLVKILRYVPVLGLIGYLVSLRKDKDF
ncbi:uncharacterized protein LOC144704743 [Wolffia australiana]